MKYSQNISFADDDVHNFIIADEIGDARRFRQVVFVCFLPRRLLSSNNAARFGKGVFEFDVGGDLNACQACAHTERALADGRYGIRNLNLRCVFYSVEGFEKPARERETGSNARAVVRRLKPDGFPPSGARFAR